MTLTREQSNWLKIMAVTFMIIDHIGLVFFPEQSAWRIVGRLAFPLFAYQLAVGFEFTRDRKTQLKYLILFALVSQIPYTLVTGMPWNELHLNVFGTFAVAYGILMLWERPNKVAFAIALGALLLTSPGMDYGLYGVILPLGFYLLRKHPVGQVLLLFVATGFKAIDGSSLQLFAVFSIFILIIVSTLKLPPIKLSKWFFYWFYPVHLTLIAVLAFILQA